MYKKKLQRLGAVCLAAAMVFTTFSFPDAVKAEEASAEVTANEEAGHDTDAGEAISFAGKCDMQYAAETTTRKGWTCKLGV